MDSIHDANLSKERLEKCLRRRKRGPGIFEYLSEGNVYEYKPSTLSIEDFNKLISELWN